MLRVGLENPARWGNACGRGWDFLDFCGTFCQEKVPDLTKNIL